MNAANHQYQSVGYFGYFFSVLGNAGFVRGLFLHGNYGNHDWVFLFSFGQCQLCKGSFLTRQLPESWVLSNDGNDKH